MTATELYRQLVALRDQAGSFHYERVALADRLLKDRAWVASPEGGGGDEDKAINRLEADCFADLCGLVSLPNLLDLLHRMPDREDWRRHKYNFRRMWAELKAREEPRPRRAPAPKPAPRGLTPVLEFSHQPPAAQRREYERAVARVEAAEEKVARLEDRVLELEEENAKLRDENRRLLYSRPRLAIG